MLTANGCLVAGFHGTLSSDEIKDIFQHPDIQDGDYLLRLSSNLPGKLVLQYAQAAGQGLIVRKVLLHLSASATSIAVSLDEFGKSNVFRNVSQLLANVPLHAVKPIPRQVPEVLRALLAPWEQNRLMQRVQAFCNSNVDSQESQGHDSSPSALGGFPGGSSRPQAPSRVVQQVRGIGSDGRDLAPSSWQPSDLGSGPTSWGFDEPQLPPARATSVESVYAPVMTGQRHAHHPASSAGLHGASPAFQTPSQHFQASAAAGHHAAPGASHTGHFAGGPSKQPMPSPGGPAMSLEYTSFGPSGMVTPAQPSAAGWHPSPAATSSGSAVVHTDYSSFAAAPHATAGREQPTSGAWQSTPPATRGGPTMVSDEYISCGAGQRGWAASPQAAGAGWSVAGEQQATHPAPQPYPSQGMLGGRVQAPPQEATAYADFPQLAGSRVGAARQGPPSMGYPPSPATASPHGFGVGQGGGFKWGSSRAAQARQQGV